MDWFTAYAEDLDYTGGTDVPLAWDVKAGTVSTDPDDQTQLILPAGVWQITASLPQVGNTPDPGTVTTVIGGGWPAPILSGDLMTIGGSIACLASSTVSHDGAAVIVQVSGRRVADLTEAQVAFLSD